MQIPKSLLIICMAALGVSSLHAQRTDSDVQTKAREQLREKLSEPQSQPAPKPVPAPVAPAVEAQPVAAVVPVASTAPVTESGQAVPVYSALDPQQDAKAREALRLKMQELKAQDKVVTETVVTPIEPKVTSKPKPAKTEKPQAVQVVPAEPKKTTKVAKTANNDAVFTITEVAPAPALNSKDAKLADLLQQYKADKITPAEYHTQRAKILSEP